MSALLLFTAAWSLLIYCPIAHSVWSSDGFLFKARASLALDSSLDRLPDSFLDRLAGETTRGSTPSGPATASVLFKARASLSIGFSIGFPIGFSIAAPAPAAASAFAPPPLLRPLRWLLTGRSAVATREDLLRYERSASATRAAVDGRRCCCCGRRCRRRCARCCCCCQARRRPVKPLQLFSLLLSPPTDGRPYAAPLCAVVTLLLRCAFPAAAPSAVPASAAAVAG